MRPNTRGGSRKGKAPFKPPQPVAPASVDDNSDREEEENDSFGEVGAQSPESSTKWTLEKEQALCELWESERHLYDATTRDYRKAASVKKPLRDLLQHLTWMVSTIIHKNSIFNELSMY